MPLLRLQIFEESETVFIGHHDVRKDKVEVLRLREVERFRGIVADGGIVPGEAESAGERRQGIGFVVDDKKMGLERHGSLLQEICLNIPEVWIGRGGNSRLSGSRMRNVVPCPGVLSAVILPA